MRPANGSTMHCSLALVGWNPMPGLFGGCYKDVHYSGGTVAATGCACVYKKENEVERIGEREKRGRAWFEYGKMRCSSMQVRCTKRTKMYNIRLQGRYSRAMAGGSRASVGILFHRCRRIRTVVGF